MTLILKKTLENINPYISHIFKDQLKGCRAKVIDTNAPIWKTLNAKAKRGISVYEEVEQEKKLRDCSLLIGPYAEIRTDTYTQKERSFVHLGTDFIVKCGHKIYSPYPGDVYRVMKSPIEGDYGQAIIIKHAIGDFNFYVLYAHLVSTLEESMPIEKGELIGVVGSETENGGWVPHLHLQILSPYLIQNNIFYGAVEEKHAAFFLSHCPNPASIFNVEMEES